LQSRRFKRPWVVSYDNAAEICEMYSMSEGMSYALHAQKRYLGSEVMFFSRDLSIAEELIPQA
jgi:DNA adenine methylase